MPKPQLRERLLGALVFLCLGLIFYPVIFDTRSNFEIDRTSQIPNQQQPIELIQISRAEPPPNARPPANPNELFAPDESQDLNARESQSEPVLTEAGTPNAWVLQVGSFTQAANAETLVNRLLTAGYKAYRREGSQDSPAFRVFVGPYLNRTLATQEQTDIEVMLNSKPLLLEFKP